MALFLLDTPAKAVPIETLDLHVDPTYHTLSPETHATYSAQIQQSYDRHRATTPPQFDPENSPILSLEHVVLDDSQRTFAIHPVRFRDYFALKNLLTKNPNDKHLLQEFVVLSMIAILETADNYLVLGHRGGEHLPNRYLPPAGFLQYDPSMTKACFAETCREEFAEEVGLSFPEELYYLGLTGDTRDSFLVVSNFYGKTSKTLDEVHALFEKDGSKKEHSHMIYLPATPDHVIPFLEGTYTGIVNPYKEIFFKDGVCTNGPKEIKGKRYEQIENGVGAFIDYLALTLTPKELDKEMTRLTEKGTIQGFVHKPLATQQRPYLTSS